MGLHTMTFVRIAGVILLALMTANCATVTRGTTSQVQINTEPSDAQITTSMGHSCRSPCTLTVDRKAEFTVVARKEGYREASVPVATRVAGSGAAGFAGNVLIGGIVGMAADAATGATLEHFPNPVAISMEPDRPAPPARRPVRRPPAAAPAAPKPTS